jgi:hypothetical protein
MQIVQWATFILRSHGYSINNPPEIVRTTPWSSVWRFIGANECIYLKQTPPALALEPTIMQILYDKFQANVPLIIAVNKELHCFLMKNSGVTLREVYKNNFDVNLLCRGIQDYIFIQYKTAKYINIFLNLGVPDWRLKKLPLLYLELINEEKLLIKEGITSDELTMLNKLYPQLLYLCELLASYDIPETLDHCDFHDNNILMEDHTKNMIIIDWGGIGYYKSTVLFTFMPTKCFT